MMTAGNVTIPVDRNGKKAALNQHGPENRASYNSLGFAVYINVTQQDIREARSKANKSKANQCPIEIAAARNLLNVAVGNATISFKFWGVHRTRRLPIEAQCFISQFDPGYLVRPLQFRLDI